MKVTKQKRLKSHFRQMLHKTLRSRESILSYTRKIRIQLDRMRDLSQSLLHSCEAITNHNVNLEYEDIEMDQRHMPESSSDDGVITYDTATPHATRDSAPLNRSLNARSCEPSTSQAPTGQDRQRVITEARDTTATRDDTARWTRCAVGPIIISDDNLEHPPTPFSLSEILGPPLRPSGSPTVRLDRTLGDTVGNVSDNQAQPVPMSDTHRSNLVSDDLSDEV